MRSYKVSYVLLNTALKLVVETNDVIIKHMRKLGYFLKKFGP